MQNQNPQRYGKVAVLLGGQYAEREISLLSGNAVLQSFLRSGIDAHAIDVDNDIGEKLLQGRYDRAFIALHGVGGEDGSIQGLLEYLKIPYTGSQVAASALAMDKQRSKWLWQGIGLPTPPFLDIAKDTSAEEIIDTIGFPLAIKPIGSGSSLGVSKVVAANQLGKALETAFNYDQRVMAERWVEGDELTIGIIGHEILPIIRITTPDGIYDYNAKYFSDATQYHIPSGLSEYQEKAAQTLALKAFAALGCRHWGRVDAIQDKNGDVWLLEINTIPGLTAHSLVPKAAKAVGINFDMLVLKILEQTLPS